MVTKKPPTKGKQPRIEFRYSWVYDQEHKLRFTDPLYPSGDKIREYIEEVSDAWRPRQRSLLNNISQLSGLSWKEEAIVCYVVGRGVPVSDPLTIPIYENNTGLFIEKFTHELIERMIMHPRNLKLRNDFWEEMFRSMTEDGIKVSYMVPVNAIYQEILNKHFPPAGGFEESLISRNLDYRRAWEIVNNIGSPIIIERFRRGKWD
jgi:hypothetical protein